MERMVYRGFESTPKHDAERGIFYGLIDGIDGLCEYESETADGVEKAFRDAVDDYLDACHESVAAQGGSPAKKNVKWACVAAAVVIAAGLGLAAMNHMAQQPSVTDPQDEDAAANAAVSGKVDESKVEEAKKDAETKANEPSSGVDAGQPAAPAGSGSDNGSNGGGSDKAPASQPGSTPSASQPSGNGGSSQPEHVHNWVAQTEQRWVQDSAAWYEPIYSQEARTICNTCGADISGNATAHLVASGRNGCSGYHTEVVQVQTGTVHHDATGHYETVTTGYVCSGCGATK